jgi:hypothetical protein
MGAGALEQNIGVKFVRIRWYIARLTPKGNCMSDYEKIYVNIKNFNVPSLLVASRRRIKLNITKIIQINPNKYTHGKNQEYRP